MTVGERMHSTLNSLQACAANVKSFALESNNEEARQLFSRYGQQLDAIVQGMQGRLSHVEAEEPQYRVREQIQNRGRNHKTDPSG